jgi:hypothetical protein
VGNFDPNFLSRGQCYVTAMCVQDIFGGDILEGVIDCGNHFWNKLPNGQEFDLTSDQFKDGDGIHAHPRRILWCTRHTLNRKNKRYLLLKKRIEQAGENLNGT